MQPGDFEIPPVTGGDLEESEFHRLITTADPDERMPNNGDRLTDAEIQRIDHWILQGAKFDGQYPAAPIQTQIPHTAHPPAPTSYPNTLPVTALAFSADGNQLLVGGYHEIMIWDPVAGTLLQRISDIPERVYGLEFSPDHRWLAVAGGTPGISGEVRLISWENGPRTGVGVKILATTDDVVFDAAFRSDSQQLAVACTDGSVRVYDVGTSQQLLKVENHADWVTDLCYSTDGKRIATASRDKTAKVFDAESGELVATYSGHGQTVQAVAFYPDAQKVISAGGHRIRVWNIEDSKVMGEMSGFQSNVYALLTDAETLIAVAADRTARSFTLADRKLVRTWTDHPNWILSLAWHGPSQRMSTGCFDGAISLWNLEDDVLLQRFVAVPPAVAPAAPSDSTPEKTAD
jgi:WD40 repeat protein